MRLSVIDVTVDYSLVHCRSTGRSSLRSGLRTLMKSVVLPRSSCFYCGTTDFSKQPNDCLKFNKAMTLFQCRNLADPPSKLSGPENNKVKKSSSLTGGPFSTSDVWRQFVTSLSEEEKSAFIYMQTKLTRAKRSLSRLVLANTGEWKEGAEEQKVLLLFF